MPRQRTLVKATLSAKPDWLPANSGLTLALKPDAIEGLADALIQAKDGEVTHASIQLHFHGGTSASLELLYGLARLTYEVLTRSPRGPLNQNVYPVALIFYGTPSCSALAATPHECASGAV